MDIIIVLTMLKPFKNVFFLEYYKYHNIYVSKSFAWYYIYSCNI